MLDAVAEHMLRDGLPVHVVEHRVAVRAVAAPPAPGPGHQEPAPGHRLHGDMRQPQLLDPRHRRQLRGMHRDPRGHRPGRARIRERGPASRDSPRGHGLQVFRRRPHRDHFASWPDRRADPDVTLLPVDDAMTTDLQDRKPHHLFAPRPVLAPPFFLPVTHRSVMFF